MRRVDFQKSAFDNLVRIILLIDADCRLITAYNINHYRHNFIKPSLAVIIYDNVIVNIVFDNIFVCLPFFYPSHRINPFFRRRGGSITVYPIERIGCDFSIVPLCITLFSIVKFSIIIFIIIRFRFSKVCTFDFRKS